MYVCVCVFCLKTSIPLTMTLSECLCARYTLLKWKEWKEEMNNKGMMMMKKEAKNRRNRNACCFKFLTPLNPFAHTHASRKHSKNKHSSCKVNVSDRWTREISKYAILVLCTLFKMESLALNFIKFLMHTFFHLCLLFHYFVLFCLDLGIPRLRCLRQTKHNAHIFIAAIVDIMIL